MYKFCVSSKSHYIKNPKAENLLWDFWSWWPDFKNLSDAQRNSPQDCFSRFRQKSKIFFHRYFAETGVLFAGSSPSFKTNKGYRRGILYLLELVAGLEPATCALRNCAGKVKIAIYSDFQPFLLSFLVLGYSLGALFCYGFPFINGRKMVVKHCLFQG